jgi:hypothetical protein
MAVHAVFYRRYGNDSFKHPIVRLTLPIGTKKHMINLKSGYALAQGAEQKMQAAALGTLLVHAAAVRNQCDMPPEDWR